MKYLIFFALLSIGFTFCTSSDNKNNESESVDNTTEIETTENTDESNTIEKEFPFLDGEGLVFDDFFNYLLSESEKEVIKKAVSEYANIKTDSALKSFYTQTCDSLLYANLNPGLYKYKSMFDYDDEEVEQKMRYTFDDELPVLVVYANTFDGTDIFIDFNKLYEKAKLTKGTADDDYFSLLVKRYGAYDCVYCDNLRSFDASYSYSKLGDGTILSYLKELVDANLNSQLFGNEYLATINYIANNSEERYYLYKKSKVVSELESIKDFMKNTQFGDSLSNSYLELIKNAGSDFYFDCENQTPSN